MQCNPIQIHNQSVPSNNIRFRGNNRFNGGGRGRGAREANNDNCRFEGNWKQQGSFQQTQIMAGPPPNLQHHSPFNPVIKNIFSKKIYSPCTVVHHNTPTLTAHGEYFYFEQHKKYSKK